MKEYFQNCFIFGVGKVFDQLGVLQLIQQTICPVVLTTATASLGHDLTATAYVIQTEIPDSYSVFVQNAGRGDRVDPTAPLTGALICTNPILTIDAVKQGCEFLQARDKLFRSDYLQCLEMLEVCCVVDSNLLTFKQAVQLFKKGESVASIHTKLSIVKRFKDIIGEVPKQVVPMSNVPILPK